MSTVVPDAAPEVPLHEQPEIHARRWFLLGIMCLSLVMVVMAVSGLNVAIPSIQRSLDASSSDLQWIVDSYAIIFAGLLLSAGAIGDRFGRKRALQGGLVLFGLGSLLGTFADSVELVIVSRAVMGVGAAFIMPATLSIISAVFPPHERSKAIAVWAGFAGAGGALGPLVVGFLLTDWWVFPAYWWGAAFLFNVVTVAIVLTAVTIWSPRSKDDEATPLDPVGAVLSIVGLAALLYGIIEGPVKGWTSVEVLAGFAIAVVGLVGFVFWELRAEHPMLPMRFFRNGGFSLGSGVITFAFFVMFGFFFLVTQFLQFVRGYSPLDAGVATLPLAAALIVVSPRSALLAERLGASRVMGVGFGFVALGFGVFTQVDASSSYLWIALGLVLLGIGMGITVAPATGSIMAAVPLNKAGVGSAVNDTTREVGGALGIAVLGSIANSAYRSGVDADLLVGLPEAAADAASEGVGAAIQIASDPRLPAQAADALRAGAQGAFSDAFNTSLGVAGVVAFVIGILVLVVGRRTDEIVEDVDSEPDDVALADAGPDGAS
ncbi:MFS transporter [Ilumatobacter nonamiensis]|uniref:MFS transporter n=1 Tax=Ilumatobacter nonamiensis TaxID=467093 RepID=UPI000348B65C|nr:MFS transporter [Ilumatobacter nonamiensis]